MANKYLNPQFYKDGFETYDRNYLLKNHKFKSYWYTYNTKNLINFVYNTDDDGIKILKRPIIKSAITKFMGYFPQEVELLLKLI